MKEFLYTSIITLCLNLLIVSSGFAQTLYGVDRDFAEISKVDPTTAVRSSIVTITLSGETVVGFTGLATQPNTNVLYGLLKVDSNPRNRRLVTINPTTGVATLVGNTGDGGHRFATIAFSDEQTLYGVTGDSSNGGAPATETLFRLSLVNGAPTFVAQLGNGNDGEAIAYNPDDGFMYHISGVGDDVVFESINLQTLAVTNILISLPHDETTSMVYDAANSDFITADVNGNLSSVTTSGTVTPIGVVTKGAGETELKGLAFSPLNAPSGGCAMSGTAAIGGTRTFGGDAVLALLLMAVLISSRQQKTSLAMVKIPAITAQLAKD